MVNSLLTAIVRADGDALVMHVGERPYVVASSGPVELSSRPLTLEAVAGMLAQLLPAEVRPVLEELGAVEHELPKSPAGQGDRFTVVAARGGEDIWIEVRRHRRMRLATRPAQPAAAAEPARPAAAPAPAAIPAPTPEAVPSGAAAAVAPAAVSAPALAMAASAGATVTRAAGPALNEIKVEAGAVTPPTAIVTPSHVDAAGATAEPVLPVAPGFATVAPPVVSVSEAGVEPPVPSVSEAVVEGPVPSVSRAVVEGPVPSVREASVEGPVVSVSEPAVEPPVPSISEAAVEGPVVSVSKAAVEPPVPSVSKAAVEGPVVSVSEAAVEPPVPSVSEAVVEGPVPSVSKAVVEGLVVSVREPAVQPPVPSVSKAAVEGPVVSVSKAAVEPLVVSVREPAVEPPVPSVSKAVVEGPVVSVSEAAVEPPVPSVSKAVVEGPVEPIVRPLVAGPIVERSHLPSFSFDAPVVAAPVPPAAPSQTLSARPAAPPAPEPGPAVVLPLARSPIRMDAQSRSLSSPRIAGIDRLLRLSAARGANTLYLMSQARPSVRVDGEIAVLEGEPALSAHEVESLLLDLAPERSREALEAGEGTEWMSEVPEVGRIRCQSFRDHRGPGGIFRMISARPTTAEQLGLAREIQALCAEPEGLVLIAGPRASGKSTLVSALVDIINRTRNDYVITVESQIAFAHESRGCLVSQREVRGGNEDIAMVVRAALRENPDVLVIEDMRSPEVVGLALEAMEAGHLVIGAVSAHGAATAIGRMLDQAPEERRGQMRLALAEGLRGVVSQVLLRKTTGGRVAAREVLLNLPSIANLIAEGRISQLPLAIDSGRKHGMVPLNDALAAFVQNGVVDVKEAYRKAFERQAFLAVLRREGVDTSFVERLA